MVCGVIKQCNALTKSKCQCKNHVTNDGDFCERHSKKETIVYVNIVPENTQEYTIPENIFVNGKFIPNINKVKIPVFKKNSTSRIGFTGFKECGKTPDEMYKYLFPN